MMNDIMYYVYSLPKQVKQHWLQNIVSPSNDVPLSKMMKSCSLSHQDKRAKSRKPQIFADSEFVILYGLKLHFIVTLDLRKFGFHMFSKK